MQAIREIKSVKNKTVTITLPSDFDSEDVEIIIMPYFKDEIKSDQPKKIDLSRFRGIYKDMEFDVLEESKKMRNEWERGI